MDIQFVRQQKYQACPSLNLNYDKIRGSKETMSTLQWQVTSLGAVQKISSSKKAICKPTCLIEPHNFKNLPSYPTSSTHYF